MEDLSWIFDPAPWVNFQRVRYMGQDASTHLLVENPDKVDRLGNTVPRETDSLEEGPPSTEMFGFRLVNSICVCRVHVDDRSKIYIHKMTTD